MKQKLISINKISLAKVAIVAVVAISSIAVIFNRTDIIAFARNYDAEINVKAREASKYTAESQRLGKMADTLQGEVDNINGQISSIQAQIDKYQKQFDDLVKKMTANQLKIDQNRDALGYILADIYVDDQISSFELLASSSSIGDYIDKQEQRSSTQQALNQKIKEIQALQEQLNADRDKTAKIIEQQKASRNQLNYKKEEKDTLLKTTKDDAANYQLLANKRNSEIAKLREDQRLANLRSAQLITGTVEYTPSIRNGGYPDIWGNAAQDTLIDNWQLYNRECVSYVAWRLWHEGKQVNPFRGQGNAKEWPYSAVAFSGARILNHPKKGTAAVTTAGPYGHVMYVEDVFDDGSILISDYNFHVTGQYREAKVTLGSGYQYLEFNNR